MLIADKIRRNDQFAQEREAAEIQKSLRRMQEIKKERIKRLKTVLQSFFEKVKSDITAQADEGRQLLEINR